MRSLSDRMGGIHLVLVAPPGAQIPGKLSKVVRDASLYEQAIGDIQRLRGKVYREDGSIPATALDGQGRHVSEHDRQAWHIVLRNEAGQTCGVIRMAVFEHARHAVALENLQVNSLLSRMAWYERLRFTAALTEFIEDSRTLHPYFLEAGGWAVAEEYRGHASSPVLALSLWALMRLLGGGLVIGSAATKHGSAMILKRLGGFEIPIGKTTLPPFPDPYYGCEIEILGFSSSRLNPRFEATVADIQNGFATTPVITHGTVL